MSWEIVNIIASARINGSIDIERLHLELQNTSYEPEMFPGLVYRRTNKPTIIMFASGKISSHGSRTLAIALSSIKEVLKDIEEMNCVYGNATIEWIRIENIVAKVNLLLEIDLEKLNYTLSSSMYDPKQFPGLTYKPLKNSVTCLVFSNGKMVIVGAKSEEQIDEAYKIMKNIIVELV